MDDVAHASPGGLQARVCLRRDCSLGYETDLRGLMKQFTDSCLWW